MEYTLDDLPRFSSWPARLLGLEPWEQRRKTPEEIDREFEREKWGPLLARVREAGRAVTVEEADEWALGNVPDNLCSVRGELELLSALEAHRRYLDLVVELLGAHLPASALVELGAGYGSVVLAMARREPFSSMPIQAGEYTQSGIALIKRLAAAQALEIEAGHCDLGSSPVSDLAIPPGALIFTSFATPYVLRLSAEFVEGLSAYEPRAVVHIEPCYEHCDNLALLGLLRRRYIEANGYNINLVTLLHEQQRVGRIAILAEEPAVFGMNPLLAASVLVWRPAA